jgi:hypothetical protein
MSKANQKEIKPGGLPCRFVITLLAFAYFVAQAGTPSVLLEPGKILADSCPNRDAITDTCVFLLSEKVCLITDRILHVSCGAELGHRCGL